SGASVVRFRAAEASRDHADRRAAREDLEELLDVRRAHPDAALAGVTPDAVRLVRAVEPEARRVPLAVVPGDPARPERVLRIAVRHRLAALREPHGLLRFLPHGEGPWPRRAALLADPHRPRG